MKELLKTRRFWRNLALMGGASLLVLVLTLMSLRWFTRHGQSYIVPDFTGLTMDQLGVLHKDYGFVFVVIDSVFDESHPAGSVLRHDPAPNATVKRGRKFYITLVSSMPDMVVMPNLIDLSLRQATALLESRGLFAGTITYRPDRFQNVVLNQTHRGLRIRSGERVRKGSYIDLIVSGREQGYLDDEDYSEYDNEMLFNDEI